ncbi:MAG: S8 family peptidase [Promethearchaeota archaeon]
MNKKRWFVFYYIWIFISMPLFIMFLPSYSDSKSILQEADSILEENKDIKIDQELQALIGDPSQQESKIVLIVKFKSSLYQEGINSIRKEEGIDVKQYFNSFSMVQISGRVQTIKKLLNNPYIEAIYLDSKRAVNQEDFTMISLKTSGASNNIVNVSEIIDLDGIYETLELNKSDEGDSTVIAILDTGIDILGQIGGDLDDFDDNSSTLLDIKIYGSVSMVSYEPLYYTDFHGSGTFHAGVASGTGGRNSTFRGISPNSYVLNVKVIDSFGFTFPSFVISGLEWALGHDADVMCLPWTFPGLYNDSISIAINEVVDKGAVVVVPTGDEGPSYMSMLTPGQSLKAITVGAYDHILNKVANFSARGPTFDMRTAPDVIAPGVNVPGPRVTFKADTNGFDLGIDASQFIGLDFSIPSFEVEVPVYGTPLDENYTLISSSTASTAIVAGVCAVLISLFPLANPELIKLSLMKTATSMIGDSSADGSGLINATAAALWLKKYTQNNYTIGTRIPQTTIYPGVITSGDWRNVTGETTTPKDWDPYNIYVMASTQAMMPAMFIVNGTSSANFSAMDIHLPLNQFVLSFNDSSYMFSELEVYRELGNITNYYGYDDGDYCRWAGILGLNNELFIVVIIETWGYVFNRSSPQLEDYTHRITAFQYTFNFINIGEKNYKNLTLHSFFKADLYLNEYNFTDPYNIEGMENATLDDWFEYDEATQTIFVADNYTVGPNATNEYTCMGFNSTSHQLSGWEINSSSILFDDLFNKNFHYSNKSETNETMPNTDLGFIQSWLISSDLGANSKVNFTGVFSISKDLDYNEAVRKMKEKIHLIQTNVTHPKVRDMAIIRTECNRMGIIDQEFEAISYIINLGNVKINSTEFWTIANFSSSPDQVTLYSSIFLIKDWEPMEILKYSVSWTPNRIGMYTFIWVVGGYLLLLFSDDSLLNNYHSRTIFIYDKVKIMPYLNEILLLAPGQFPVNPFIIQYPGDIAIVNITLISPVGLDDLTLSVRGPQSSMINLQKTIYTNLERQELIMMSIIVPMFYKAGIYLLNLDFRINNDKIFLTLPIQFKIEDYKGRVLFDGIHNEIIPDIEALNATKSGLKLNTILKERLDTIFGNFYQFREILASFSPKGIAMSQIIPGINVTDLLASQLDSGELSEGTGIGGDMADSFAFSSIFRGDNFFKFAEGDLTTDQYTYDLIKFFDCVIISDPEIPFSNDEILNITRYLNLGGIVFVFAENGTENDLTSINNLIGVGGLEIYSQNMSKIEISLDNFEGSDYDLSFHYPMKVRNKSNDISNIDLINDYIAIAQVGEGKIVVLGDEDIITEQYIHVLNNTDFILDFFQYIMNNTLEVSVKISSDELEWGEKTYISMSLDNPTEGKLLQEDYLGILGFVDDEGEAFNANIFGFEIPFMPMLLTNGTATYSYFDSRWTLNEYNQISIVLYCDTPSKLSETFSFIITITPGDVPEGLEKFSARPPQYSAIIDIIFLLLLLLSLCSIWLYSMDKWKARHRFVEIDEENQNLIDNTMSSLQSEIKQLEIGILSEKLEGLEKVRFILKHEELLRKKMKELEKLATDLGER